MRAPRACATPGCPVVVTSGHCSSHARPGPRARGYDSQHDRMRQQYIEPTCQADRVTAGDAEDASPTPADMDLGHDDHDRSSPEAPNTGTATGQQQAKPAHH
jgi:hypothetical protein